MDMYSGVNPAQSDIVRANFPGDREEKGDIYHREPPPAYEASYNYVPPAVTPAPVSNPPITHQPVINQPVTNQPTTRTVIVHLPLKHSPTLFNCPKCDERIVTNVTYSSTNKTHMLAGFVCGMTCWCCLCCLAAIPYLTKVFKEAQHTCPNCKAVLGSYSKF